MSVLVESKQMANLLRVNGTCIHVEMHFTVRWDEEEQKTEAL